MDFINNDFDLVHIFECGQCFRWNKISDGRYFGVVGNYALTVTQAENQISIDCDDEPFLTQYFNLDNDYSVIKKNLSDVDDILGKSIPYGGGIRLLKQDPWETIVSFIISANNNIPRIKKIIESLCENFGEKITYNGKIYHSFPSADKISELTLDDLAVIKSGFRAKYILDAAQKIKSCCVDILLPYEMETSAAREYLKQIKGVGDKVADCILLFAYQKYDVFPKDVWTKRVLNILYGVDEKDFDSFITEHFGELAGFAQQYLFYYMRENSDFK